MTELLTRRSFLTKGILSLGAAMALGPDALRPAQPSRAAGGQHTSTPPLNLVVVITDDQDRASLSVMRRLLSYPAGGWTNFTTAVANQAICAPSRATLLTGRYPHNHGVTTNNLKGQLDTSSFMPVWLKDAGYKVAHIGKWLKGNGRISKPPGFDVFSQGGRAGTVFPKGCDFIRAAAGQPFALFLCPVDPHRRARPASQYARTDLTLPPLPPVETDLSDKPEWVQRRASSRADEKERLNAYRSLLGVDDGIFNIIETLSETGVLDNTAIIFTSDNGYSWGSNGVSGKNAPYDPSILIPMLVRVPGLPDREEPRIVSMVDLAVTIADLAGVTPPHPTDGRSLVPMLHDATAPWDSVALIEGYPDRRRPAGSWWGVRTDRYAYVENNTGELELYDLAVDPFEHENAANKPEYAGVQAELAGKLAQLMA